MTWSPRTYVATRYAGAAEASEVAARLRRAGVGTTSKWHDGGELPGDGRDPTRRREICARNVADLRAADACLVLAHPDARGTLIELALAWSWGKRVVVVGARPDVTLMAELPGVEWVATVDDAVARLQRPRGEW